MYGQKTNTFLFFSLSTICKSVIYNKNIFHGNNVDWNFIRDCSVKITLLFKSKSKSRIFNKIFNNKIFSNPELDKIYIVIIQNCEINHDYLLSNNYNSLINK